MRASYRGAVWVLLALLPARLVSQQAETSARQDPVPQRDIMDIVSRVLHGKPKLSDTIAVPPRTVITILPAISASPTTGLLLGVSGNAVTRLGTDESTNLSTISASVNYTTKQQFNILLRSNVYTFGQWLEARRRLALPRQQPADLRTGPGAARRVRVADGLQPDSIL